MDVSILAMAAGMVRFSNMEYELVSESADRATVRATGDVTIGEKTETFEKEYLLVKQDGKWLISY